MSSFRSVSPSESDTSKATGPGSLRPGPAEAAPLNPGRVRLEAAGLGLSWDGEAVCKDVSFDVREGELLCLVGKSGSGKTTIFHALAGLMMPEAGRVLLDGEDVTGRPGKVSYMLQKDLLLDQHTVIDNVSMPLRIAGASKGEARDAAQARMAEFGLQGAEKSYPSQLSGGMRQRAALLRTYLMNNDVVLMDEPFSALDAFTRKDMQQWFLSMLTRLELSSVLVTHDVDEALAMGDRIMVLAGNPAAGTPSSIAGMVDVPCPREFREGFLLTDEALEAKKQVLALLA